MNLTHFVSAAGEVQDALGGRSLSSVYVGHDPDISDPTKFDAAGHNDRP
jgi:hypothetical protein